MHSVLITHALKLWSENTDTSQCMCEVENFTILLLVSVLAYIKQTSLFLNNFISISLRTSTSPYFSKVKYLALQSWSYK